MIDKPIVFNLLLNPKEFVHEREIVEHLRRLLPTWRVPRSGASTSDLTIGHTKRVMRNTIDACKRHSSALVFFDNVYAYGQVDGVMTEETPYSPCSRKGEVRARIATMLMDEVRRGELRGMIVRSADFYGQVWHALTSREPMTGEEYVRIACALAGRPYALQVAPRWLLSLMGLFVPVLRENMEMLYQFEHDYRFDSSKAERAFGLTPTAYREGIAATLKGFRTGTCS